MLGPIKAKPCGWPRKTRPALTGPARGGCRIGGRDGRMLAARVEPKNAPQESKKTDNFKPLVFSQFQAGVDSRKGSQASEDPGVAANATGVLAEASVADIMRAVFDRPMLADNLGTEGGGQQELADEIGDFARCVPKAGGDVAPVDGA